MAFNFGQIISADSHVIEPADLWWKAIGHQYGDRTPRLIDEYMGKKGRFFATGSQVLKLSETEAEIDGMGDLVDAGQVPETRIKFQDQAGVQAEVLNPTIMMLNLTGTDKEVIQASSSAYNDWLSEFTSYSPKRLLGTGVVPIYDVEWGIRELNRIARNGLSGAMINVEPPEDCPPYRNTYYDPFWKTAEDLGVPITLHSITGRIPDPLHFHTQEDLGSAPRTWVYLFLEIAGALANEFIFGGILDRFPKLKLICSEWEISWIPSFMFRIDQIQAATAHRMALPKLKMTASEYVKSRMWHGMIDDPYGKDALRHIGADAVLWGSDFPHVRSIGLDAHEALSRILAGLTTEEQQKLVGGNAAKVHAL